ncbi:hypothetical protein JW905_17125, partial [bacterium]|nr:hypothetical protein [candidate division CSSED10-310 bacterium]
MKRTMFLVMTAILVMAPWLAAAQENGGMFFSKSMIDPVTREGMTAEFQSGDHIYGLALMEKSILETIGKESAKSVPVEIFIYELKAPLYDYQQPSEMQLETSTMMVSGEALKRQYLPIDIVPDTTTLTAYTGGDLVYKKFGPKYDGPVKFAERLAQLEAGSHTIIVKLNCNYSVVSEGRFVITGDEYGSYKQAAADLNEYAVNIATKGAVMPKAARSDDTLEKEMIAAFQASQTYQDRVKGEVLRVVI